MKHNAPLFIIIIAIFAFAGCKKNNAAVTKPTATPDIYVAGSIQSLQVYAVAAYWKNGSMVKLVADTTAPSEADAIAVSGNDVYVAGFITGPNSHTEAAMWKNGIITKLTDGTTDAAANSISIYGSDVYVAGNIAPASGGTIQTAAYWKNGALASLIDTASLSDESGIMVNNNGIFLAGNHLDNSKDVEGTGAYLKNGSFTKLQHYSEPMAITVNGDDVYLAGSNYYPAQTIYLATYWKNGATTQLTDAHTYGNATGIAVSGNDVYVSGNIFFNEEQWVPTYWKNGDQISLNDSNLTNASINWAYAITVLNNKVYTVGAAQNNAGYWINDGAFVQLAKNGSGRAIAVVAK